jgi:hypothetical protein
MPRRTLTLALSAGIVLSASVALARQPAAPGVIDSSHGSPPGEVARIQAHLAEVEREMLARDVSHLTEAQRQARAGRIAALRAYRERGVFPHNHDFAGERVPYFVDEHGTRCAMAYLIEQSGGGDLVRRVAATANNARVPELAGDAELTAWLDANGLTLAEAARVQPTYDGCGWDGIPCPDEPEPSEARVTARYGAASAVASGTSVAALVWSLREASTAGRTTSRGWLGLAAGAAALWIGASQFDERGAPLAVGATNATIGAATAAVALRDLLRSAPPAASADSAIAPGAAGRGVAVSLAPHLEPREGSVGLRIGLTF